MSSLNITLCKRQTGSGNPRTNKHRPRNYLFKVFSKWTDSCLALLISLVILMRNSSNLVNVLTSVCCNVFHSSASCSLVRELKREIHFSPSIKNETSSKFYIDTLRQESLCLLVHKPSRECFSYVCKIDK